MTATSIPFHAAEGLLPFLDQSITKVSFRMADHGKCGMVTLWHNDQEGLSIHSRMHDVAEKLEVGILTFEKSRGGIAGEVFFDCQGSLRVTAAWKLTIQEAGLLLESGLRFAFSNGKELVLVPADFPCFLSVQGSLTQNINPVSEYPLGDYHQEQIL
jgi:hypothetical protein